MSDESAQKLVPAVQNATAILRLLAAGSTPMGATQIARDAGLNVSTAFNILRTLAHEGIVSFDPADKTYRIGMGLLEFATPLLGANPADLIRPLLNAIAQEHQVMIALWQVTAGKRIVLIDRFAAPNIVQAVIARHSRLPVFAGAIGRCYAAQMKLSRSRARRGYDGVRWQSAPGFDSYWQDVQTAAQTGIGQDRGQLFRGLDIIAALACDKDDTPRLGLSSITIAGQHDDDSLSRIGPALLSAAKQIERTIFGRAAGI